MTAGDASPKPLSRFTDRVVIVTGSSAHGIGFASARRIGQEGGRVVVNGRHQDRVDVAVKELRDEGIDAVGVSGDLEDPSTSTALVDAALERFGRLDGLVNTIGGAGSSPAPLLSLTRDTYLSTVATNTWGMLALVQEAVPRAMAQQGGAIVNISSTTVNKTSPRMGAYAAGKSALNALTRTLARDLSSSGIRVNAIAPSVTRSEGNRRIWADDDGATAGKEYPLGRIGNPEDQAAAVAFLLSDDAAWITGVVIDVDGGNHLLGGGWTPMKQ
jgi:NAD(P)-dependent dehydrogenase (short-subunit alcohol dehydrogenase family)